MVGRPPRRDAQELCKRLEGARADAGLSRAAIARALGTSPSNLLRSLRAGGFSGDLSRRVEMLLENGVSGMRDVPPKAREAGDDSLDRALLLLLEFRKMVPDLERALVAVRRAANAEDGR